MSKFLKRSAQGAGVPHEKRTSNLETVVMPLPSKIVLSMGQHIGAPAAPAVAKGDQVYVGTVVGKAGGFVSSDIHSGVSGTVIAIEEQRNAAGGFETLVVIETDKKQELSEEVKVPEEPKDLAEFVKAVRESGLVGLGGASFPTHIKFNPKNIDDVHALVVNAAECEPFITSDHRLMLETPDALLDGCLLIMKYIGLDKGYIAIEENKMDAIQLLDKRIKERGITNIETFKLQARYPKGAERVLVYEITGKNMDAGVLPADMGVILDNVTTVAFVGQYFKTGRPLTTKRVMHPFSCWTSLPPIWTA